jgi:hypothetical protein
MDYRYINYLIKLETIFTSGLKCGIYMVNPISESSFSVQKESIIIIESSVIPPSSSSTINVAV